MKKEVNVYEKYLEEFFETALQNYRETEECKELDIECEKAEEKLKDKFSEEDYQFAIKETDVFVMKAESEGKFLYKQGFKDCIAFLSQLGVL